MQSLRRMEGKIDDIKNTQPSEPGPSSPARTARLNQYHQSAEALLTLRGDIPGTSGPVNFTAGSSVVSPATPPVVDSSTPLSFSAHLTLSWLGIDTLLPASVVDICRDYGLGYASGMELNRPPLAEFKELADSNCISGVSLRVFNDLSHSFFRSFNTALPILDKDVYFQHTLVTAMNSDFGVNLDTCVVMLVMALGSWGEKRNSPAGAASQRYGSAERDDFKDDHPGLTYFNEARRRLAAFDCNLGLQSCQVYLLMGYVLHRNMAVPVS